jgi:Retrotransposon gag protein
MSGPSRQPLCTRQHEPPASPLSAVSPPRPTWAEETIDPTPNLAHQWRPTPERRRSNTNVSLPVTPRRRILPLPTAIHQARSDATEHTPTLQDIPEWKQLHPETRQEPDTTNITQATTPRWEAESIGPAGLPIEVMNILEDMHRRMEAMITAHAAATPETRTEMPLTYETSPQSGHSPTLIHDFLTTMQTRTQTPQSFDYAAYVGATRQITPTPVQPSVQRPTVPPIQTNIIYDYELAGLSPTIFTGKQTDSDRFLKEFKQWRLLNRDHIEMKQLYNRVLMALSYIKGPKVDDWQEGQLTELELDNQNENDETIWTDFEQRFKNAFTDTNKKQQAYDRLMSLRLKDGDIDTYIATFDNLIAKIG